jgi:hypothetical protein
MMSQELNRFLGGVSQFPSPPVSGPLARLVLPFLQGRTGGQKPLSAVDKKICWEREAGTGWWVTRWASQWPVLGFHAIPARFYEKGKKKKTRPGARPSLACLLHSTSSAPRPFSQMCHFQGHCLLAGT